MGMLFIEKLALSLRAYVHYDKCARSQMRNVRFFLLSELCFAWRTTSVTDDSAFPSERFTLQASEHIRVVYFGLK